MTIIVDGEQTQFLRDILEGTLIQLRIEIARADMHDFRKLLHHRERIVEKLLDQIRPVMSQAS
jgi:hypothetical protein